MGEKTSAFSLNFSSISRTETDRSLKEPQESGRRKNSLWTSMGAIGRILPPVFDLTPAEERTPPELLLLKVPVEIPMRLATVCKAER